MTRANRNAANAVAEIVPTIEPEVGQQLAIAANPYERMLDKLLASGQGLEQMQNLLDLQIQWEKNEARKAFVAAMAAFKQMPLTILKSKRVYFEPREGPAVEYYHAELADCTKELVPALAQVGISHRWDVKQEGGAIQVTCTLTHRLGHSESVTMSALPDDSGKKNKIQQVASANTYLQRYTFLAITGMATEGMDDDGGGYDDDRGEDDEGNQHQGGNGVRASQSPEAIAARKARHDEAAGRHSESITYIKECLARGDLKAAAAEWRGFSHDDQTALWLAPSKGGIFTTAERATLHDKLPPRE
jgi:hypothetical protein